MDGSGRYRAYSRSGSGMETEKVEVENEGKVSQQWGRLSAG